MHILLTRPIDDSMDMILKFKSLGHVVSHIPLLSIQKLSYKEINYSKCSGIIFTSSNAIKCLDLRKINKNIYCFCVGVSTEKEAKKSGMVLLDDNSLIDTEKNKIADENKIIQPLQDKELETFDHYTSSEIEKFVIRLSDRDKYLVDDEQFNSNKIINYLDKFNIHNKSFDPYIPHKTGFSLSLLNGKNAHVHEYTLEKSEVLHCLSGSWEINCDGQKVVINSRDTFSVPKDSARSIQQISENDGSLFIIRQTN